MGRCLGKGRSRISLLSASARGCLTPSHDGRLRNETKGTDSRQSPLSYQPGPGYAKRAVFTASRDKELKPGCSGSCTVLPSQTLFLILVGELCAMERRRDALCLVSCAVRHLIPPGKISHAVFRVEYLVRIHSQGTGTSALVGPCWHTVEQCGFPLRHSRQICH